MVLDRKYILKLETELQNLRAMRDSENKRVDELKAMWLTEKESLLLRIRQLQRDLKKEDLKSNKNVLHVFFEKTCALEQELQIAIEQIVNYREQIDLLKKQVGNLKLVLARCVSMAEESAPELAAQFRGTTIENLSGENLVDLKNYFEGDHEDEPPVEFGEVEEALKYKATDFFQNKEVIVNIDEVRDALLEEIESRWEYF